MDMGIATRIVEGGLGRQAAATAAGDLVRTFEQLVPDVANAALEAMQGSTVWARICDRTVTTHAQVNVRTVLDGGAGPAAVEALEGLETLLREAGSLASVAGDRSLGRVIDAGRSRIRMAQHLVSEAVAEAEHRAVRPTVPRDHVKARLQLPAWDSVPAPSKELPTVEYLGQLLAGARQSAHTARRLADQAGERIADFDEVGRIAHVARSRAAAATGTREEVGALVHGVRDLLAHIRTVAEERLPATFQMRHQRGLDLDALAFERHVTVNQIAHGEAEKLLESAIARIDAPNTAEHALLDRLRTAKREIAAIAGTGVEYSHHPTAWSGQAEAARELVDHGVDIAYVEAGYGTEQVVLSAGEWSHDLRVGLGGLFGRGFTGTKVSKELLADPTGTVARTFTSQALLRAQSAVADVVEHLDAGSDAAATRSMIGTGTTAAVSDALAAARARFGSADELRAALDAAAAWPAPRAAI